MSWREKLGVSENSDRSDKSTSSVTFVTGSKGTPKVNVRSCLDPEHPDVVSARSLLNRTGARLMQLEGIITIGVWPDHDGPEIREALRIVGHGLLPIRYLDGAGIPQQYKVRGEEREPGSHEIA
jgi:hypothetical protein